MWLLQCKYLIVVKSTAFFAHLTYERDWLLAHGVSVSNIGLDDLGERLLQSLEGERVEDTSRDVTMSKKK